MIKNIVREHSWPPHVIGGLFIEDAGYESIIFWNDDVITTNKELIKPVKPKGKK